MKTERLTVAQGIVKFLNNQYIEFDGKESKFVHGVFTIFGHGNVLGLGQALEEDSGDLIVHQGRNEQGMAHAAIGFAKQMNRKKIYACTSSVGPGAANMVTAAATATANRIPVLFLPGDTYATRQPDPVLQQIEQFHDFSITTNDAYRAVSKYWDRVHRPEQVMTAMIHAMRVLTDPADIGAVTVCLPQDVQGEAFDFPVSFLEKRVHRIERRPATDSMVNEAVNVIKSAKKPLLICGGGVRYSEAGDVFSDFAETFQVPFGETQAGKSAVTWDHPMNLGGIGTTGNLAANVIARDADVVIAVGTRLTDFTTASKWLYQGKNVKFVAINVAEFDTYKFDAVRVVADAKEGLTSLKEALSAANYRSSYNGEIAKAQNDWKNELNRLFSVEYRAEGFSPEVAGHQDEVLSEFAKEYDTEFTQTKALGILDKYMKPSDIVVGASGSLPGDLQRIWRPKEKNTYHMEYGYSCMGYEVNAALGAKLACRDQEVYAFVGDGSYMMLHSELPTSIQEKKKINIILFDNASFGCINNLQMDNGQGSFGTETRYRDEKSGRLTGQFVKVDFAKNAESYGCKTWVCKTEDELISALEESRKSDVSTLIDVKILPKTMTHGYDAFWRVGSAEVAKNNTIVEKNKEMKDQLKKAVQY